MRTRRHDERDDSTYHTLELEVLRQQCHVANPLMNSVSRPKVQQPESNICQGSGSDVDTEKARKKILMKRMEKIYRFDVTPIQPLCGVSLQCRRIQANLSQSAVARMTGSSEAFIEAIEIGTQAPSHELWQRIVASIS